MSKDVLSELEKRITEMQHEINVLRARTDLSSVINKIDSSARETRLMYTGLMDTLQKMIIDLNAEGVKRYDAAIKSVNDNTTQRINELKLVLQQKETKLLNPASDS